MNCRYILAICLIYFVWSVGDTRAGSIVLGEIKTIDPPSAITQTSVEFYLEQTDVDDGIPLSVGNFQVRVVLNGADAGSAVRIVDIVPTTDFTQAYPLDTTNVSAGISAYAATFNLADPFDIADGAGLVKLELEVHPSASGLYTLSVLTGAGNTEFTSPVDFATALTVELGSGSIFVAVPEPSGFYLAVFALIAVFSVRQFRRADSRL